MNTKANIDAAIKELDCIGTQASAITTLADLLYAVDAQSEYLKPETLNHMGCLLEVIGESMIKSAFEARNKLGAYDT